MTDILAQIETLKSVAPTLPDGAVHIVVSSAKREDVLQIRQREPGTGRQNMHMLGTMFAFRKEPPDAVLVTGAVWMRHAESQVAPREGLERTTGLLILASTRDREGFAVLFDGQSWEQHRFSGHRDEVHVLGAFWDGVERRFDPSLVGPLELRWVTPCPWMDDPQAWFGTATAPYTHLPQVLQAMDPLRWSGLSTKERRKLVQFVRNSFRNAGRKIGEWNYFR